MNTTDLSSARWRKSSRSNGKSNCVKIADLHGGNRAVRDSKNPAGPALIFTAAGWSAFTTDVHAGKFG